MKISDRIIKEIIKYSNCESIRYYIDITNEFCNLFGSVVKQVKIELDEIWDYEYDGEEELQELEKDIYKIAEDMFNWVDICLKENKIDLSGMHIYITFFNDKTLKFWNSDLGGIEKI